MALRCKFCRKLIIHRFHGRYMRQDYKRKYRHEKMCKGNPDFYRKSKFTVAQYNALQLWRYLYG